MKKIAINGRIFEYPITGVGRFCYEVIKEIDLMPKAKEYILLVSNEARNIPRLKNIDIKKVGKRSGIIWEQVELPLYLYRNHLKCLSMSSSIPILKHEYTLIHDISLKVNKKEMSSIKEKLKIWWPLLQYYIAFKTSKVIFTVTEFQKNEIEREYKVQKVPIVVYAGWQHMRRFRSDANVMNKYGLRPQEYLFAVSTRSKNKNFKWIWEAAQYNPTLTFVISGKMSSKFFADAIDLECPQNIITTGYITDEEVKTLMENAKAFLYPSIYEGFGIPPLEALSCGTKAIVAKSSCLPEVYGNSVYYIDPYNPQIDIEAILERAVEDPTETLAKYSWYDTACRIYKQLEKDMSC